MHRYKLVLVGPGGAGKSTFLHRHMTGEFRKHYVATLGVEVHPLTFNTNYGLLTFDVWDCAGVEKFGGLRDGYYIKGDCVMGMFDLTSRMSFHDVPNWVRSVHRVTGAIPTVICGNKTDLKSPIKAPQLPGTDNYFSISAKSNYNFEKPFLYLARKLTGHKDLQFIAHAPAMPVEIGAPAPDALADTLDGLSVACCTDKECECY